MNEPRSNPSAYSTWERFWLKGGNPESEERTQAGTLLASTIRAQQNERAMAATLTVRCQRCSRYWVGPASKSIARFKTHRCR